MSKLKKELMFLMPKLRRYCYGLTGNKDRGDDLLHNSVVKILEKLNLIKKNHLVKKEEFYQTRRPKKKLGLWQKHL